MTESIEHLFYRGDYLSLLEATVDSPAWKRAVEDLPFVVGALSFTGRVSEGELLLEQWGTALDNRFLIPCRFFIGVTLCRNLDFKRARLYFAKNVRSWRRCQDDIQRFYVLQGLVFYRYTYGYLKQSLSYSSRAYEYAFRAGFHFGRILAQELKGHALINLGAVRQGLAALRSAGQWAAALGRGSTVQAIESSIELYSTIHGIAKDPVSKMNTLLSQVRFEDTYIHTFIRLELARQLQLTGNLTEAKEVLDHACQRAYQFNNVRLEALLNFRLAMHLFGSGDLSQALNLIKNTQMRLQPDVDKLLETKVLGLEITILKRLGMPAANEEKRIRSLSARTGHFVSQRISRRTTSQGTGTMAPGQDPLGDLLDSVYSKRLAAIPEVLESGYLSLIYDCLGTGTRGKYIVFGLEGQSLTILDGGDVYHLPDGISNLQRKLLQFLAEGEASKEALTEALWGQKYHPLRHDSLIYTLVSKLRRTLGQRAKWIEASEVGYRLDESIRLRSIERSKQENRKSSAAPSSDADFENESAIPGPIQELLDHNSSVLNFRQIEAVKSVAKGGLLDVGKYKGMFAVSPITASRDLSQLESLGLLNKMGKGRATKYIIQSSGTLSSKKVFRHRPICDSDK